MLAAIPAADSIANPGPRAVGVERPKTVRVLPDPHVFLWWSLHSEKISTAPLEEFDDDSNDIAVSAATAWEIVTKFRIGKLPRCEAVAIDHAGHIRLEGFEELPISVADAERHGHLPGPHRDPFDRTLATQAPASDLAFISADRVFDRFNVDRLW